MNFSKLYLFCPMALALCMLNLGCSAHSGNKASATTDNALPSSWVNLRDSKSGGSATTQETSEIDSTEPLVMPSASTDRAVQSAFNANVSALTQADAMKTAIPNLNASAGSHPSDWTPWHLDGMVGYFAISHGGLLGALLYAGTESIKLTWQKVTAQAAPAPVALSNSTVLKMPALKVTTGMTARDLPMALEPSIQVALASGKIQNESAFRSNMLTQAQKFLTISQVLSGIPRSSEWYVDGYQLNLSISVSGEVVPLVSLGGAINLYFDWSRTSDPTVNPAPSQATLSPDASLLAEELQNFVSLMSFEIPQAIIESTNVQENGFYLDMIQVGLGITAGGDIGVAQVTSGGIGRVIFKRDVSVVPSTTQPSGLDPSQSMTVMPALANVGPAGFSYQISARKVRRGLKKAISMANYFANRAKNAENTHYHLNQIEAEFDTSLTGDFKLAAVSGIGQFVLDFDWISN